MFGNAQADLIRASGLFDPEFYRRIYGHWIADGEDPPHHFLEVGLAQGYLPSADFDPVLYKVLVPKCGDDNPLLHCLASGVPFQPPPLREMFPEVEAQVSSRSKLTAGLQYTRVYANDVAMARELPFSVNGTPYALRISEPEALIERLRADRPFAYARLPHGFWDALWVRDIAESALAADERSRGLPLVQRKALALRLCSSIRSGHGAFAPSFIDEVLADIPVHATHRDFLRAVSLTGYPAYDGDVVGMSEAGPPRHAILRSFASHFRPGEILFDAMAWKRMLFAGHLAALPELCRDRPVVLVASAFFSALDERWRLEDFAHVQIPRSLTQWQRWDLLDRTTKAVAAACERSGRPPVVLTQCGGSLAYWLITRLFTEFPRAFYLDLGQALNGWFFDVPKLTTSAWARLYARSTIENSNLESYYRTRLGARYDEWLTALSNLPRKAGAAHDQPAGTETSGAREISGLEASALVEAIRTRRPKLFESDLTERTAGALLKQAFHLIREHLHNAPEGVLNITGLGTFQVRNAERGDADARVTRKVINLVTKPSDGRHSA